MASAPSLPSRRASVVHSPRAQRREEIHGPRPPGPRPQGAERPRPPLHRGSQGPVPRDNDARPQQAGPRPLGLLRVLRLEPPADLRPRRERLPQDARRGGQDRQPPEALRLSRCPAASSRTTSRRESPSSRPPRRRTAPSCRPTCPRASSRAASSACSPTSSPRRRRSTASS